MLYRIESSYFTAGFVYDNGIKEIAPIIYWMKKNKWNIEQITKYCNKKGWSICLN